MFSGILDIFRHFKYFLEFPIFSGISNIFRHFEYVQPFIIFLGISNMFRHFENVQAFRIFSGILNMFRHFEYFLAFQIFSGISTFNQTYLKIENDKKLNFSPHLLIFSCAIGSQAIGIRFFPTTFIKNNFLDIIFYVFSCIYLCPDRTSQLV